MSFHGTKVVQNCHRASITKAFINETPKNTHKKQAISQILYTFAPL